jgi:hypothetical protein
LVQEVAVDVDAVGFGEVGGDQLAHGRDLRGFLGRIILDIVEFVAHEEVDFCKLRCM